MSEVIKGSIGPTRLYSEIGIAILLGALWLFVQGFQFGVGNNIFHIPLVLRWNELGAFADDPFYQTLPNFTSALWWLLRLFVTEESIRAVFLFTHVIGQLGSVAALLYMLRALTGSTWERLVALLVILSSPLMRNASPVGGHGMLIGYLTHTEFLWPFFVGSLVLAREGRWRWSAAFAAITLSINAFVGIWCLTVLAVSSYFGTRKPIARQLLQAALVFVCIAGPVLAWIVSVSMFRDPYLGDFSYVDYIRAYYPTHFLIETATPYAIIKVCAVAICALYACRVLDSRFWTAVIVALCGLVLCGATAPYVFDSRFLFNLHLLRADGALLFVAVPLIAAAAMQLLREQTAERDKWVMGVSLILGCFTGHFLPTIVLSLLLRSFPSRTQRLIASIAVVLVLASIFTLASTFDSEQRSLAALAPFAAAALLAARDGATRARITTAAAASFVFVVLFAIALAYNRVSLGGTIESTIAISLLLLGQYPHTLQGLVPQRALRWAGQYVIPALTISVVCLLTLLQLASEWSERPSTARLSPRELGWVEMTEWVREQPLRGPILIPLYPEGINIDHNFQLHSRKSVWVDWKQGAAVMWAPSFHKVWRPRFEAVRQLRSPHEYIQYARENGIRWVLIQHSEEHPTGCPGRANTVHTTAYLSLCEAL